MKNINLGKIGLNASEISLGVMRISNLELCEAAKVIDTAIQNGINFFDHADIYGAGVCEEIFAKAAKEISLKREDMLLQTKCGIRPMDNFRTFDFSKEHILSQVDASLKRLQTDYIDVLLLHRPDTLMQPEEIAEAFNALKYQGKVKYFGVSNFNHMQVELLQKHLNHKLIVNQLQFGIMHTGMIDHGFYVNRKENFAIDHDGSILEYCRLKDITIQAWSPYQMSNPYGVFLDNQNLPELNKYLNQLAQTYNVETTAIATAWILRHPAKMQTIIGSMNPKRITDICKASNITLSREEWYKIYFAAGNDLP